MTAKLRLAPLLFALLQGADFATTVAAIKLGGSEQNFMVSQLMSLHPWHGLIIAKVIVLGIAIALVIRKRHRIIIWANVFYSCVVIWNVMVIARLAAHAART